MTESLVFFRDYQTNPEKKKFQKLRRPTNTLEATVINKKEATISENHIGTKYNKKWGENSRN